MADCTGSHILFFYLFGSEGQMSSKSKWDKEYSTSFYDEVVFLRKKGIRYTWVYNNEYGISVWKYKKEKKLWDALSEMYSTIKHTQ